MNAQKINLNIKNSFSKCEHIRIKLRVHTNLLNHFLTGNFIFSVVNIIGFAAESCKFFLQT